MSDNAFFPIVQAVCNSHRWRLLGVMLSVLALGACALNPSTYFYSLSGLEAGASREPVAEATTKTYGIGPVFLPESLMQPGIVSEGDGQMLSVSLYHIWAGNLRDGMTRVLAANLSDLTGWSAIWPFPWDNRARPDRQLRIVVERFSGNLDGEVYLTAKWALTDATGEKVLQQARNHYRVAVSGSGYGPYVDAMNQAINQFSTDLATTLAKIP